MIRFSFETINRIKRKVNLLELVLEYEPDITKISDNLWVCRCPHPDHDDKTPSFRIWLNPDNTWSWACMGCHVGEKTKDRESDEKNYGTDAIAFVRWISDYEGSPHKIGFKEAVLSLAKRVGEDNLISEDRGNDEGEKLIRFNHYFAKGYQASLTKTARSYLLDRGLSEEDIQEWKIGYGAFHEFRSKEVVPRIIFPLENREKKIVGFTSRVFLPLDPKAPKYVNSSNSLVFSKKRFLYGYDKVDPSSSNEIVITEGVFDVILAHKYGMKNVVGTLGTALTKEHILTIKELKLIPVLCMDGDEAGRKGIARALKLLAEEKIFAKVFLIPQGKDLADLALQYKEELTNLISTQAKPYWKHFADAEVQKFETQVSLLRTQLLPSLLKLKETCSSEEEYLVMKSFIKEKVGLLIE